MGMSQLINEVNALVTTFRDKDKAITSALTAAVAAAPTLERTFYVDAVTGNDNSEGTQAAPFKTLKKAVPAIPYGGGGIIYLAGAQEHIIDSLIQVPWRSIIFAATPGASEKPTIKNVCTTDDNSTAGFAMNNASLYFSGLVLRTADYRIANAPTNNVYMGLIRRNDRPAGPVSVSGCEIRLGDTPFMRLTSNGQMGSLALYSVAITRVGTNPSAALLDAANIPCLLAAGAVTAPAGAKWLNDLVTGVVLDANNVPRNILTNLIL